MPTFDRTTIVRGPCKMTYDSQTFYSKGGVSITLTNSTFDKETDAYGVVGRSKTDLQVIVEFEPVGEIEALTVLFPYGSTTIGTSIFTSSDKPLVIAAADATYTIKCAAVTQMPTIRCTANNTAFGTVQFTGILDKTTGDPSNLASYYAVSAGASIGATFDPSKLITAPYTATLAALTFYSEAGFEIAFEQSNTPIVVDGIGTVDMALANLGFTVTCIPTGVAENSFDAYFGSLDAGEELASAALDISTATSGGLNFDALAVQVIDLQKRFSPSENRLGTLTMQGKRTFSTGAPQALFTIASVT